MSFIKTKLLNSVPDTPPIPSALSAALSHNDLLSDAKQHSIHSLIYNYKEDLRSVASEIARVEAILDGLRSRRATIVSHIRSCRLAIAPHRKLPNEILAKIFMDSAHDPVSIFPWDKIQRSTPYNILLVCSRWKNIALALWGLWNHLKADCRYVWRTHPLNFKEKLGIFLSRSGLSPISLAIHCNIFSHNSQSMADLLLSSESRLTTLTLDLPRISAIEFLYSIPSGFFANLEAASVIISRPPTKQIKAFHTASRPREFTIRSDSDIIGMFSFKPTRLLLPWSHLTTLHFPNNFKVAPSRVHAILTQCSALISCSLAMARKDDDPETRRVPFPIFLPKLRELHLTICDGSAPYLHDLVFSGLTKLELNFPPLFHFETSSWENDFRPFISRISELHTLRVSQFEGIPIPEASVRNVLANVPSLTSFIYLEGDILSDRTLAMMASGSLVPRLKNLICRVTSPTPLYDMLESRLSNAHLTTI